MNYADFLARKLAVAQPGGFEPGPLHPSLFPFQADLVRWALRRGRAAVFAHTGLGKTRMQLEWARHVAERTDMPVLVLTPLAVAAQTVAEGASIGIEVTHCRDMGSASSRGINVTNYERLHKFEPAVFGGVVLDESSLIKHFHSKTLAQLLEAFGQTPYRLCATATPAPNDWTELATHADFLGVCTRQEMLSEFFVHDGGDTQTWRLKGHARQAFWRWVASWGAMVRSPADLGHDASAYELPELVTRHHVQRVDQSKVQVFGELFVPDSIGLNERRAARKATMPERVAALAALVNADRQPWVVWCDLNAESEALTAAIPDALEVTGAMEIEEKERRLVAFGKGEARVIVSKPSIAGHGLNWQHCARMAFVGLTDSWEAYFQAVRRCWRFGQRKPVQVHVFASELDAPVLRNIERKAADAETMAEELSRETAETVRAEVLGVSRLRNLNDHRKRPALPSWLQTEEAP